MDTNQPTTLYAPASAAPGLFGTKMPSTVAFAIGILLFLLPFAEIRCAGQKVATKSGLDFALGNDWKTQTGGMLGKNDYKDEAMSMGKEQKGNTQYYAIGAAALALLGLLLSFANSKTSSAGGLVSGILSSGALVGLVLDEKKNYAASLKAQALDKAKEGVDSLGFDKIGNTMGDAKMTLAFSTWIYIAIIAFLAAAFFCYKRMSTPKKL